MSAETDNAINSVARTVLSEFNSKTNTLTYRQILDKHAKRIEMLIPAKHRRVAWIWLNCVCQNLASEKEESNHGKNDVHSGI